MTPRELLELPAVVNVTTAAEVLGIGMSSAYELVRCGEWPTPVLRLRGAIRIPTAPLLALLGLSVNQDPQADLALTAELTPGPALERPGTLP